MPPSPPSSSGSAQSTPRRVFVEAREIPGLVSGAARGDRAALRRILGGRRSGRLAVLAAIGGLALACAPADVPRVLAAHAALSCAGWESRRRRTGLSLRQHQRLLLWLVAPALWLAAPLRPIDPGAAAPLLALAAAHVLAWSHLGRTQPLGPRATDPWDQGAACRGATDAT
jgi:hypothetical protein